MRAVVSDRRLWFAAVLLYAGTGLATAFSERPLPDGTAIEEVLRGTGLSEGRYVSARAVEHYLRARLALEDGVLERAEAELSLAAVYDPQSAWPRYAMAVEHLRHGESQEAERDLRVALQVDPRHSPSLRLRARLLLDQGRVAQALTTLATATRSDPGDPESYALLVRACLAQGRLDEARAAADKLDGATARVRDGERVPVAQALALAARSHQILAEALETAGRFEEAEASYRRSIARQPDVARLDAFAGFLEARHRYEEAALLAARALSLARPTPSRLLRVAHLQLEAGQPRASAAYVRLAAELRDEAQDLDALVTMGASLLKANETQVALEAFEAALAQAPDHDDARWFAALATEATGRFDDAIAHYRKLRPGSRLSTLGAARAAWCEHRLGRHEEALQSLVTLAEERPDDEEVLLVLARVREAAGQPERAIVEVEQRLVRHPSRRLMLELAGMYRRHRRGPEAVAMLELERRAAPKDEAVAWSLAQSLAAAGRTDRALVEAKSLLVRHPPRGEVANFVAWLLAEQGSSPEAAENYAWLALELEPGRWEYLDTLGWAQLKAGKAAQAVETLERARALAPDALDVAMHLAEALAAAGRSEQAMTLLKDLTLRTRDPAFALRHERAARLLESLAASAAPTADATKPAVAP